MATAANRTAADGGATNEVLPLHALHYDASRVGQIGACLAQPYDVITPAMQEAYHGLHPYNVVRLILGRQFATDTAADNRYTRAAATLDDWLGRWRAARPPHGPRSGCTSRVSHCPRLAPGRSPG